MDRLTFTLISWSEHSANFASSHSGNIDLRTEDIWLAGNLFLVHSPKHHALIWMSYDKWWARWKTSSTVVLDQYDFRTVVLRIFSPPFIEPACDVAFVLSIYLINIVTRLLKRLCSLCAINLNSFFSPVCAPCLSLPKEQDTYSLRRPPKLIIPQAVIEQRWASVCRFMFNQTWGWGQ